MALARSTKELGYCLSFDCSTTESGRNWLFLPTQPCIPCTAYRWRLEGHEQGSRYDSRVLILEAPGVVDCSRVHLGRRRSVLLGHGLALATSAYSHSLHCQLIHDYLFQDLVEPSASNEALLSHGLAPLIRRSVAYRHRCRRIAMGSCREYLLYHI